MAAVFAAVLISCALHEPDDTLFQKIGKQIEAGNYAPARDAAERAWRRNPNSEWGWKFKSQYVLVLIILRDPERASRLLADDVPASFPGLKPRYQYLRAYLALSKDTSTALAAAESTLQIAEAQRDPAVEIDALALLGILHHEQELKLLTRALSIARQNHLEFQEASTLMNLGMVMHDLEQYSDGISYLTTAAALAKRIGARFLETYIRMDLGECYLGLGDMDRALQILQEAQTQLHDDDPVSARAETNVELGKIYALRQGNAEAIRYFRNAFAIVQADQNLESYVPTAQKLASGLIASQQSDEAEKYNELAYARLKQDPAADPYQLAFYQLNRGDIAAQRKQVATAEGCYRKVLDMPRQQLASIRWTAYARLAELAAGQGNMAEAREKFENTLTAIEENRTLQAETDQITFLSALIRFYQQYVEFLVRQGDSWEALAVADSSRAGVLTRGLQSSRTQPDFLAKLRKQARLSNSVLLFYWLAPQRSFLWAVTPNGQEFHELPAADKITHPVQRYSNFIVGAVGDPLKTLNPVGMALYRTLIAPVAAQVAKGMRVVVVPDGALHGLNFETLLVAGDHPHYWLEDVYLTVVPSLRMLLAGGDGKRRSGGALVIGDGDYSGGKYPPLPESKKEVAQVSGLFPEGIKVLMQRQAVPGAYRRVRPQSFSLIHFSAHVETNEQSPLDSAIILSADEYGNRELTARELMSIPLSADLVTISGCNSGGRKVLSGEGMVGFAWAAFEAGARNAVTSLWEVDDHSTTELMAHFYTEVRQGKPYAVALRDAKSRMLNTQFKKPYYWAPFQLYSRNLLPGGFPVSRRNGRRD